MELDKLTMTGLCEYYSQRIAERYSVSLKMAKDLWLNAMTYSTVVSAIEEQIDFLLED